MIVDGGTFVAATPGATNQVATRTATIVEMVPAIFAPTDRPARPIRAPATTNTMPPMIAAIDSTAATDTVSSITWGSSPTPIASVTPPAVIRPIDRVALLQRTRCDASTKYTPTPRYRAWNSDSDRRISTWRTIQPISATRPGATARWFVGGRSTPTTPNS